MATYLVLNIVVLCVLIALLIALRLRFDRSMIVAIVVLLATTACFDSLMIQVGIMAYNKERIIGLFVGNAPVEDFFYTLAAGLMIPTIWRKLERNDDPHGKNKTTN